jgi:hypothetical protein
VDPKKTKEFFERVREFKSASSGWQTLLIGGFVLAGSGYLLNRWKPRLFMWRKATSAHPLDKISPPTSVEPTRESLKSAELDNVYAGRDFESFVVRKFIRPYFTPIEWTGDKGVDGIYPLSNSNPDLVYEFQLREFKRKFAVECKYRRHTKDNVSVAKPEQLTRYKAFAIEKNLRVYIALGLGGSPHNPKELYLIPLDECKSDMTYEELRNYSRSTKDIWFYKPESDRLT